MDAPHSDLVRNNFLSIAKVVELIPISPHKPSVRRALLALAILVPFLMLVRTAYAVDSDSVPGGTDPIAAPEVGAPTIFLTFDDGPFQPWTQQIIDVLAEYDAHATFFMVGRQAILEPETLKKIYDGGNGLGNHGYNHANLTGVSQQFFDAEVGDTGALFGDMNSMCLRPPYGAIDYNVVDFAEKLGYSVVKWNMDPEDWGSPGASVIARHVIDNARDGSIVVMHDGGGDRSQTVAALRVILKTLTARGFNFKALCRDYPMESLTEPLLATPTPDPSATLVPQPTVTPTPTETPTLAPTATETPTVTPTVPPTATPALADDNAAKPAESSLSAQIGPAQSAAGSTRPTLLSDSATVSPSLTTAPPAVDATSGPTQTPQLAQSTTAEVKPGNPAATPGPAATPSPALMRYSDKSPFPIPARPFPAPCLYRVTQTTRRLQSGNLI